MLRAGGFTVKIFIPKDRIQAMAIGTDEILTVLDSQKAVVYRAFSVLAWGLAAVRRPVVRVMTGGAGNLSGATRFAVLVIYRQGLVRRTSESLSYFA